MENPIVGPYRSRRRCECKNAASVCDAFAAVLPPHSPLLRCCQFLLPPQGPSASCQPVDMTAPYKFEIPQMSCKEGPVLHSFLFAHERGKVQQREATDTTLAQLLNYSELGSEYTEYILASCVYISITGPLDAYSFTTTAFKNVGQHWSIRNATCGCPRIVHLLQTNV